MSGEAKVESILALEQQIREHEKAVINLKRARNALLNISTLPPEVLGNIFQCNVTLQGDFDGLEDGSHNFLFVCHHWHEVALRTPGVWSFWGNTPEDWARWHRHSRTAPLDLVLGPHYAGDDSNNDGGGGCGPFDVVLQETLQDRAARDAIRRIHLWNEDASLLSSIISSLTTICEGVRSNSVESIILVDRSEVPSGISDFFTCYRFPKLQHLNLYCCRIASWDLLASRTATLTTLILSFDDLIPTTSQVLSILASNPTLQKVSLSGYAIPDDGGGEFPLRVPLHHLKQLELAGCLQRVLGLLCHLDHPRKMDRLEITLFDCAVTDIPQTIGPYLQDHFRHRGRSCDGLGLRVTQSECHIALYAGDMHGTGSPGLMTYLNRFLSLDIQLGQMSDDLLEKGVLDLITHTPRDDIVRFDSLCRLATVDDISVQFPNLRTLRLENGAIPLPTIFPEPRVGGDEEVLHYLQHIEFLRSPGGDDWGPLMAFLARRASTEERFGSLAITHSHVCPEVKERIGRMVQVFRHLGSNGRCPFGTCPEQ